jgi:hypothetical protein
MPTVSMKPCVRIASHRSKPLATKTTPSRAPANPVLSTPLRPW